MTTPQPGVFGRVELKITVAVVLSLLCLLFIGLYISFPTWRDEIQFSAAVVWGAAAVYAAYYTAKSLSLSVVLARDKNSFDMLRDLNQIHITKIRASIDSKIPPNGPTPSPSELSKLITGDTQLMEDVHLFLGLFEDTSIAIKNDHVNERILYDSLAFLVPYAYKRLWPYIEFIRERDGDRDVFIELERLSTAWEQGKSLRTGEPLG